MKFDHLMREFPLDTEAVKNLSEFFLAIAKENRTVSLSFERLFEIANPTSLASMSRIVQALIAQELLTQVYRVEYSSGITSKNYKNLAEVPEVLYDRDGLEIIPDVFNTKAYYIFNGEHVTV